jgi:hypothetical protein
MKNRKWFTWMRPSESFLVLLVFALIGLLLIAISLITKEPCWWSYFREFIKELGIVVFAVFSVSLLYEITVAKKYSDRFLDQLRSEIDKGESNGASCANLGIRKIYVTRDKFEIENPLSAAISTLSKDSKVRIIAISLSLFMSKSELIKEALKQGVHLELALFNPEGKKENFDKFEHLEASDIHSTVRVFQKRIVEWIKKENPKGTIELKFHDVTIFDSFSYFKSTNDEYCIWDLSFGRDTTTKRVFILDPLKPLGKDLKQRYDQIWGQGKTCFSYDGTIIIEDNLNMPILI